MKQCAGTSHGCLALVFLCLALTVRSAEVMPQAPARYFNDYANVTTAATAQRLNSQLEQFEKDTSSQIVVAVFPKMQSDSSVEDYVHRMFVAWKIGQKGKNNGALLAVFVQDRRMRIEVGYGLEGAIPDAIAKRIVSDEMAPRFRAGDFEGGLAAATSALMSAARGEYQGSGRTAAQGRGNRSLGGGFIFLLFVGLVLLSMLSRVFRGSVYRSRGYSRWGGLPTIWTGGGGGGGWSGGGGFSGGGGDSGGGGASGSW